MRTGSAGLLLLALLGVGGIAPASASCTDDSGPSGSSIVFVGSADEQRRGFTRFSVSEVWEGPDLAPEVWVRTGEEQPAWPLSMLARVGSSGDAEFQDGGIYVVGASEDFVANDCTVAEASVGLDEFRYRPDEPRASVASGVEGADPPIGPLGQALSVAGFLVILGAGVALAGRYRARRGT